ncbi:sterol desaturase [Anaerolinea thermolimosa]|uniref:sterol desaturase family protein n=1 Tax=Anaerolinea thermolimosa TaxID=229919 RepID=UPI00078666E6|nr:sterol desaturase family protein [Anaerolinea thermolimosa]GAP06721.1 sterol desaturase [Anaerolinea thermolimosa]
MAHFPIDHSDVPIRLFKSDFLEFFTHISPVAVVIIWVPVSLFFLLKGVVQPVQPNSSWGYLPIAFLTGAFLWTFAEYTLHRFLFHYQPKTPRAERIFFLFHGVHHAQPQCKTRLVMPPVVSIPMAFMAYGLLYLLFGWILRLPLWVGPVFSGFIAGYLFYDLTHYATHHFPMRRGVWKYLKRYHMQHHYKTPNARFGVSSPLWDLIFGTKPAP